MAPLALLTPLLFGTAATTGGAAATTGLIGTAGAFSLGTAAVTVGTAMGVAGTIKAGREGQATLDYQAKLEKREARAKRQKALFDQKRHAKRSAEIESTLKKDLAVSGARSDVGAPLMLKEEQKAELELENLFIGAEGKAFATDAELQAKLYKKKGKAVRTASYYNAGSTLLTGFGDTF